MRYLRSACLAALLSSLVTASHARADADSEALLDEGVGLRLDGREGEALDRFQQAYELEPSPRAAAQMGLAEKSLRRFVEAEAHLAEALAATEDPWVIANRQALEAAATFVAKHLAWLETKVDVPHAQLFVNGAEVGTLPAPPLRVVAGTVVIEVRATGYDRFRSEQAIAAGQTTTLDVVLSKTPAVVVRSPTPAPVVEPSPDPSADEPPSWTPFIVAGGALAAVGLGVGIGLGVRAIDLKHERDDICPTARCETQAGVELDSEARAMATGSTVSFVIAGAAAGATLLLWLLEPDAPVTTNAGVSVTPTGLAGRF
ncbi:MAG: hypothetical protein KC731_23220 [Myxococcales bacterium]|nr:hypothetical protein [Myxococcales bacterium]